MDLSDEKKLLFASYREGDRQYQLAGGQEGCFKLANDFYDIMEELSEAKHILSLHPNNLEESRDKLARFLCFYKEWATFIPGKIRNYSIGSGSCTYSNWF